MDHLAQVCWEGILGGQVVVTLAWLVVAECLCLALLCEGTLISKLCDYVDNFPIEIRITACLGVTGEGKEVTRSLTPR